MTKSIALEFTDLNRDHRSHNRDRAAPAAGPGEPQARRSPDEAATRYIKPKKTTNMFNEVDRMAVSRHTPRCWNPMTRRC
jgi:hypothetical protein